MLTKMRLPPYLPTRTRSGARPRTSKSVIDLESALPRFSGDMSFLLELLGEFIRQVESGGKQMRDALRSGDADTLSRLAHSLKGAAAAFSAKRLVESALELELRVKAGDLSEAEMFIAKMEAEAPLLKEFLAQHQA